MFVDVSVLTGKHRPYLYILWHLIWKDRRLWPQLFVQLWYFLLFKVGAISEESLQHKRWDFLANKQPGQFQAAFKKKKRNRQIPLLKSAVVADQVPTWLLKLVAPEYQVRGLAVDAKGHILYSTLDSRLDQQAELIFSPFTVKHFLSNYAGRIYFNGHYSASYRSYLWREFGKTIRDVVLIAAASAAFASLIVFISGQQYNPGMVNQVLTSRRLLLLNSLPIFCLALLLYAIFNSLAWSIGISGFVFSILGIVDFFMLRYRSYPFKYSDIFLSGEAMNMGHRYSYVPPISIVVLLLAALIVLIFIHFIVKPAKQGLIKGLVLGACGIAVWLAAAPRFYYNDSYYNHIANVKYGSKWNGTDQYMTKGFVYSFVHSKSETGLQAPAGYSEQAAEKILKRYHYHAIPKSKRINIILLQLEAFQDFSKYKKLQINPEAYAGLNQVRQQSMHGELTTTIFGGGTVDTERKSITGYSQMQPLNSNASSFVRYFNANHYYTLKMHPGYGWFYNRQNIAKYVGFDQFLDKENYYNKHVSKAAIVKDRLVFNDLSKQFSRRTQHQKLFTQLVTYQNHGPYPTTYKGTAWLPKKEGYDKANYAIINNYLTGVHQTSDQLLRLTEMFERKKQPVIIAFWGDHNPWGGNNNSTYKMLGINLDQSQKQGFNNYFNTPYCIWANQAARRKLKKQFAGEGPQISPMYVLPTIFQHIGVKGDAYMQLLTHLQKEVPVFGLNNRYLYDDRLVSKLPKHVRQEVHDFRIVQYYRQTHEMMN